MSAWIQHSLPNSFLLFNIFGCLQFFYVDNSTAINISRQKTSYELELFPQGRDQERDYYVSHRHIRAFDTQPI